MSDPFVKTVSINYMKNFISMKSINKNFYDGIIVAVGHNIFKKMGINSIKKFGITNSIFYDLKNIF